MVCDLESHVVGPFQRDVCDIWEQKLRFIYSLSLLKTLFMNTYCNPVLLLGRLII